MCNWIWCVYIPMAQGLKDKKKDGTKEMWNGSWMIYIWSRIWSMGLIHLCFLESFSLCSLFRDRSQEEKHCKAWFICSICAFDRPDKAYWLTNDSAWCKKIAPLQRWSSSKGTTSCLWPQVVSHVFFPWRASDDAMSIDSFLTNNQYSIFKRSPMFWFSHWWKYKYSARNDLTGLKC